MSVELLKLGIIGCGSQAHALIDSISRIAGLSRPRIAALCDPWPYALLRACNKIT